MAARVYSFRRPDGLMLLEPVTTFALPEWTQRVRYVRRVYGHGYALVVAVAA